MSDAPGPFVVVDEVSRETATHLEATDAILVFKADGDGAFVVEPRDD